MKKMLTVLLLISLWSCKAENKSCLSLDTALLDTIVNKYSAFSVKKNYDQTKEYKLIFIEFDKRSFEYKVKVTFGNNLYGRHAPSYIFYYNGIPCLVYTSADFIIDTDSQKEFAALQKKYTFEPPDLLHPEELYLDIKDSKVYIDSIKGNYGDIFFD